MSELHWNNFARLAAEKMSAALLNKLSLEELSEFFENAGEIHNSDLRRFLVRYVWEIDGSPETYNEILHQLQRGATESDLVNYMNS